MRIVNITALLLEPRSTWAQLRVAAQACEAVTFGPREGWFDGFRVSGWWFGTCFIFPYIGHHHPSCLVFFKRGCNHQPDWHDFSIAFLAEVVMRCHGPQGYERGMF